MPVIPPLESAGRRYASVRSIPKGPASRSLRRLRRRSSRPDTPPESRAAPAPTPTRCGGENFVCRLDRPLCFRPSGRRAGLLPGLVCSRWRLRDQSAETPLTPTVFGDCTLKCGAIEIGPIDRHEDELAISCLPEQEIRQALLAAGADDYIGVRQIRLVKMTRQELRRDVIRRKAARKHFESEPPRCARDFLPRAIIESNDEHQTVVAHGQVFGFFKKPANIGG